MWEIQNITVRSSDSVTNGWFPQTNKRPTVFLIIKPNGRIYL